MTKADRQQQARDLTRRAILDAALELFVADGYAQVSMRNIAAKVDYSPAAIYSYFPSKDDIFHALAVEGFRLLGTAHMTSAPSADPLDDIRTAPWQLYEFSKRQPQYFALVFLDRHVPRIARDSEQFAFMVEIKNAIRTRMQRCIDTGVFPPTLEADVALRLILAPVMGLAMLRLSGRLMPHEDADALVRDAIETTIAGLRAGAATHAKGKESL
jgi:AcrR family transcriptional regulator